MYKGPGVNSMFGTLEKGGQCDWSRVSGRRCGQIGNGR